MRVLLRPRWVVGTVIAVSLIGLFVSLGLWQLRRLDERRDRNAAVEERESLPVAPVSEVVPADAGLDDVAELVLDQLLGGESRRSPEAVILRYERFVGAGRRPYLAPRMREMRAEFDALLVAVLARAGATLDQRALMRLVALVDGTVVNSLIEADPDPRAAARAALLDELGT